VAEVERDVAATLPPGYSAIVTGPLAVVSRMIDEIRDTQIGSFGSALLLVFVLTALCLRSIPLALLALVPTTLPVLLTLGAMGLDVPLDMAPRWWPPSCSVSAWTGAACSRIGASASSAQAKAAIDTALLSRAACSRPPRRSAGAPCWCSCPESLAGFGVVSAVAIIASARGLLVLPRCC
jgi:hypothetical protein